MPAHEKTFERSLRKRPKAAGRLADHQNRAATGAGKIDGARECAYRCHAAARMVGRSAWPDGGRKEQASKTIRFYWLQGTAGNLPGAKNFTRSTGGDSASNAAICQAASNLVPQRAGRTLVEWIW